MFIRDCFLNLHWSESWIGLTCEITHILLYYELMENSQRNINLMQNALIQIISFFPTDELFWKYTNWFYQLQFSFRYYGRETEARLWWIKKWRGQLLAYITIITNRDRSIKIPDHFTYTSADVTNCITRPYNKKLYIGETGRRLGDRFRGHLHDVERSEKDAPVARHLNLPSHSKEHMALCGLSPHLSGSENRKTREHGINVRFLFN